MSADQAKAIYITNETPPRILLVKGRSENCPDCLVARAEGDIKSLWIVDDQGSHPERSYVFGLGGEVYARKIVSEIPSEGGRQ